MHDYMEFWWAQHVVQFIGAGIFIGVSAVVIGALVLRDYIKIKKESKK